MKSTKVRDVSLSGLTDKPESERVLLGRRLRAAREGKKMSRTYVCERLPISVSTLQAWEEGEREPDATQLGRMASLYGAELDWLILGRSPGASSSGSEQPEEGRMKMGANEPPPLVHSHPEQLDHKAMWGCMRFAMQLLKATEMTPEDAADFGMRMYAIAAASGSEGYEAAKFAISQFREGLKFQQPL